MPKKIIRAEENYKIESFNFKVFRSVQRGVTQYVFKSFDSDSNLEDDSTISGKNDKIEEVIEDTKKDQIAIDKDNYKPQNSEPIDIEEVKSKAREEGYNEGYEKGLQNGLKKAEEYKKEYEAKKDDYLEVLKNGVREAITKIDEVKKAVLSLDEELPNIVLNYIKEIIGVERKLNDELIVSVFKKHMEKIKNATNVIIYVNPDDLDILKSEFNDFDFVPDENVNKGGFRVKTNIGEFDFTIETLMKNFEKTLYEEIETS
ncbi:flagellar assembly protein FliH [Deferribacter desulfuricans SSM1]|uniref:Flagellar assembly protein FliH n=1 Tax=Deferribacter desulfuricans (strain DSM 14783 / JCM 11476 / NBRC 101012 / SSM1) TaxID=639282 RepID=D3PBP5_DEFDS|nr:FliH/SctL family protein [Deferribacter desulfuricans]BAI80018.1 flagellar assembly protein FliH [Deferribacter desulfuricans SSM1]